VGLVLSSPHYTLELPQNTLSNTSKTTSEAIPQDPTYGRAYAAFLFDMDGTLINSIASANRVWRHWATSHGIDPELVLRAMHGVRAVDTIRRLNIPGLDPEYESRLSTERRRFCEPCPRIDGPS